MVILDSQDVGSLDIILGDEVHSSISRKVSLPTAQMQRDGAVPAEYTRLVQMRWIAAHGIRGLAENRPDGARYDVPRD